MIVKYEGVEANQIFTKKKGATIIAPFIIYYKIIVLFHSFQILIEFTIS